MKIDISRKELKVWLDKKGIEYNKDLKSIDCSELQNLLQDIEQDNIKVSWSNYELSLLNCLTYLDDYLIIVGNILIPSKEQKLIGTSYKNIDDIVGGIKYKHENKVTSAMLLEKLENQKGKVTGSQQMALKELGDVWGDMKNGADLSKTRYGKIAQRSYKVIDEYWARTDELYKAIVVFSGPENEKRLAHLLMMTNSIHGFSENLLVKVAGINEQECKSAISLAKKVILSLS